MTKKVSLIRGDGIGPEIIDATLRVFDALDADLSWEEVMAGSGAHAETGSPLPLAVGRMVMYKALGDLPWTPWGSFRPPTTARRKISGPLPPAALSVAVPSWRAPVSRAISPP